MIPEAIYFPYLEFTAYIKNYIGLLPFLIIKSFKSKGRNHLISVEDKLHVCLSKVRPRIKHLCRKKQAQVSH
jgi:hypothetical protein